MVLAFKSTKTGETDEDEAEAALPPAHQTRSLSLRTEPISARTVSRTNSERGMA
jgi:hypothetical protein